MKPYDLIIFDCDGTLVDSEFCTNQCALDILKEYGLNYTIDHAYQHWLGKDFFVILRNEEAANGITLPIDEIYQKFLDRTPQYHEKYLKAIDGALESVRALKRNYKTCVASNGEKSNVMSSLRLCGYGDVFREAEIFTKNDVERPKPFPDLFIHAAGKYGIAPDKTIVIEDSLTGIRAGRAANMKVIGFSGVAKHEGSGFEDMIEAGADIVFSSWKDILDHINSL